MGVRRSRKALLAFLLAGPWLACGLPLDGQAPVPAPGQGSDASPGPTPTHDASHESSTADTTSDVGDDVVGDAGGTKIDAGPLADWKKRIQLTIHNESHPQFDAFPILVVLNPSRIGYADLQPKGQDVRFTDAGGNLLPHEIEAFVVGGTSFVWVKVQAAAAATSTVWMYYANPTAPDAQDPVALWHATYVGVWHMVDAHDSTGAHASTAGGFTTTTGPLGDPAATFDGMSQSIDTLSTDQLATFTLEAFVTSQNAPQAAAHSYPIIRGANYQMLWNADAIYPSYVASLTAQFDTSWPEVNFSALSGNTWYYLAATYDGANMRAYVDGQLSNEMAQTGAPVADTSDAVIASLFPGTVSEARISSIAHSGDWLAAQNASLRDLGYVTYGPPASL